VVMNCSATDSPNITCKGWAVIALSEEECGRTASVLILQGHGSTGATNTAGSDSLALLRHHLACAATLPAAHLDCEAQVCVYAGYYASTLPWCAVISGACMQHTV
jgi:hypothetical protein